VQARLTSASTNHAADADGRFLAARPGAAWVIASRAARHSLSHSTDRNQTELLAAGQTLQPI
jgi:hypothetical protein